jgi:hypothetical protein
MAGVVCQQAAQIEAFVQIVRRHGPEGAVHEIEENGAGFYAKADKDDPGEDLDGSVQCSLTDVHG